MKNKFISLIVLNIIISFCFTETKNDEYFLWKEAEIYFQQKKYDDALKIYLEIFEKNPTSYEYLKKIKIIQSQKQEYDVLISCYNNFINNTLNTKLLFEAETDLIEIKIWNKDQSWINDLYDLEQKYQDQKNNIFKFEFLLLKISKNKKISYAYDFIKYIRKKYDVPDFFSRKLISIFKDEKKFKHSIDESIIFLTESKKNNNISSISKNIIIDQLFESLDIVLIESQINNNYLPISNKQFSSNLFFNFKQQINYSNNEIDYLIQTYNKLITNNIRIDDCILALSDIYLNIYSDLDSAFYILNKINNKSLNNNYSKIKARQSNILISKGYLDSALKIISINNYNDENFTLDNKIKFKNIEILLYKGNYNMFNQNLDSLLSEVKLDEKTYNDLLELKMISLFFKEDKDKFQMYSNILYKIKMNKSFESILDLIELINDKNILISELAHFQYALIELQKGNIHNTQKLINEMKNKTVYSEISTIINAEIEDRINKNYKKAMSLYEKILEDFPNTIYKEDILKRLNELNKLIMEDYEL